MFQLDRLLRDINIGIIKNDNFKPIFLNLKPKIKTLRNMKIEQHNRLGKKLSARTKNKKMGQEYVQNND
jgi:hypothetical protein